MQMPLDTNKNQIDPPPPLIDTNSQKTLSNKKT